MTFSFGSSPPLGIMIRPFSNKKRVIQKIRVRRNKKKKNRSKFSHINMRMILSSLDCLERDYNGRSGHRDCSLRKSPDPDLHSGSVCAAWERHWPVCRERHATTSPDLSKCSPSHVPRPNMYVQQGNRAYVQLTFGIPN